MKFVCIVGFLLGLGIALLSGAEGCGDPNIDAVKLFPCVNAAKDRQAPVSSSCCSQVRQLQGQGPQCLCNAMLSNVARSTGSKPEIAVTIPKRCNIANRPVGYKCGGYTLP